MLGKARFSGLPKPATAQDYVAASEEIIAALSRLPGVIAIYRTGSISHLGISDLDFIAVVEGGTVLPHVWNELSPKTRYLSMHGPAIADVRSFGEHPWYASPEPLELIWGRPVDIEPRPPGPAPGILQAAEGLTNGFLRLMKQAVTYRVKVRPVLCELNTLKYDLTNAGLDPENCEEAWSLVHDVHETRSNWFEDPPNLLRQVLLRSPGAFEAAIDALVARARRLNLVGEAQVSEKVSMRLGAPWHRVTVVSADSNAFEAFGPLWSQLRLPTGRRLAEVVWRSGSWRIAVPSEFFQLLIGNLSSEHSVYVSQRTRRVEYYQEFVKKYAQGYSMLGLAAPYLTD